MRKKGLFKVRHTSNYDAVFIKRTVWNMFASLILSSHRLNIHMSLPINPPSLLSPFVFLIDDTDLSDLLGQAMSLSELR